MLPHLGYFVHLILKSNISKVLPLRLSTGYISQNSSLISVCHNFCGFLGKFAKSLIFQSLTRKMLSFFRALSKVSQSNLFVDFHVEKLFSKSFLRIFKPYFQNRQNKIWILLKYFRNLTLKPNTSKILYETSTGHIFRNSWLRCIS